MSHASGAHNLSPTQREDLAATLAAQAQAGLTRNRPRWLVLLAGLVFAIGAGVAMHGLRTASNALDRAERARRTSDNTLESLAHLDSLIKSGAGTGPTLTSEGQLFSRIEAAAVRLGLPTPPPPSKSTRPRNDIGAVQIDIRYNNIRHESPDVLLRWLATSLTDVPGLEVGSVSLTPESTVWKMDVRFTRWESQEKPT